MLQSKNIKTVSVIVILLILVVGYVLFRKYPAPNQENLLTSDSVDDRSATVIVENTPMVNGTFSVPTGFPLDIPLERDGILESATTRYPGQNARQSSISYRSSRTLAQKYTEYRDYMRQAGYQMTEGNTTSPIKNISGAPVRNIVGAKGSESLSVTITSHSDGGTIVQLYYLLTSLSN